MTASIALPQLPLSFETLDLYGEDRLWPPEPQSGFHRLLRGRTAKAQPLVERVGWGNPDPADISQLDLVSFRHEWEMLDDSSWGEDERQFESPALLRRGIGLSPRSLATFRLLVDHRQELASTREAMILQSEPASNVENSGYTIVHVATGIMGSFYVDSGWGAVFAKSYSNDLKPKYLADSSPQRFYGYGVGRRLYSAAQILWPNVRWQDGAVRSTSHSLRKALHEVDPFTWQDKLCQKCLQPWRTASRAELARRHP